MRCTFYAFLALLFCLCSISYAQTKGLYAAKADKESSMLRVIALDATVSMNGKEIKTNINKISDYQIYNAGTHTVRFNASTQEVTLKKGILYTICIKNDKLFLFEDRPSDLPTKAILRIYNITPHPLSLYAPDFKTSIFDNVAAYTATSREINAVTTTLQLLHNGETLGKIDSLTLKRNEGMNIMAYEDKKGTIIRTFKDQIFGR